jgi:ABC-type Fe3+-hydroxamate transport system substrate-binding protein
MCMLRLAAPLLALLLTACHDAQASPAGGCRERVVSLHDVTTEAVLRFGAAECLAGVAEPTDLPPELIGQLTRVPRVQSAESVLAVQPSQVLALAVVAEHEPALFRELDRRGIGWTAPRLERLTDVAALANEVARRVDRTAQSDAWMKQLAESARTQERRSERLRPKVFVFDCCAPPFTAGRRAVLTDLLAHAGADNVFADVDDDWFHASWEAAVAREPDLVLIDDYGDSESLAKKRAALGEITPLSQLPVLVLPLRDSLGTIRSAEVIERLASAIGRSLG